MRTTAIRGTAVAVLLSATALGLSGCVNAERPAQPGAGESVSYGPPPSTAPVAADTQHNQADVTFVDQAVLLRQQAVRIAYLAGPGSTDPKLQALATQLTSDTVPQVNTLLSWLTQWQQQAPASTDTVPGLLTEAQVTQLQGAKGAAFDTQWKQAVRANLTAAQQDAATEESAGSSPEAKQVATQWATVLQGELTKLAALG